MSRKTGGRIAICTAAVGCGHSTAAKAIVQALSAADPTVQVDMIEALELVPRWFNAVYRDGYLKLIQHAPALVGKLYDATDRYETRRGPAHMLENRVLRDLVHHPVIQAADVVMTTHFLCGRVLSWAKADGMLRSPLMVCVTDQHPHGTWLTPHADLTLVASAEARGLVVQRGLSEQRVMVSGIAINPRHAGTMNRQEARRMLQVPPEKPLILLVGGGLGLGGMGEVARQILGSSLQAHLVVLCGKNEGLRRELEEWAGGRGEGGPSCQVLGFSTQMPEWMSAADVMIGKPGGLTTSEACAWGLPMVLVRPIPGQEERNARRLVECGAAILAQNEREAATSAMGLVSDAGRLASMRACAKTLGVPHAASLVALAGLRMLEQAERRDRVSRDGVADMTRVRGIAALDRDPCPVC